MALRIEKRDIEKIKVDAVVNLSNPYLVNESIGSDLVIRNAAGPELDNALSQIGHCEPGSAIMTDAFNMPKCKHIIHIARTSDSVERAEERNLFESCVFSALDLAASHHLKSIAFPIFSYGALPYETALIYQTAVSSIRHWLSVNDDMDVIIVLSRRSRAELRRMINSGYRYFAQLAKKESERVSAKGTVETEVLEAFHSFIPPEHNFNNPYRDFIVAPIVTGTSEHLSSPLPKAEDYSAQDLSFAEMCEWWCEKKNIGKRDFLSRSNITRATFSNIRLHPDRSPKKTTVLACAIGLELDLDQTKDLLLRAGMALSRYYSLDRYISQCILCRQYDIDAINYELFEMDLPLLGYSKKD